MVSYRFYAYLMLFQPKYEMFPRNISKDSASLLWEGSDAMESSGGSD